MSCQQRYAIAAQDRRLLGYREIEHRQHLLYALARVLISAFRYGTLYLNTESMEVQVHGSNCCFLRLYEVWYRSMSIPWLSIAAINNT